MITTENFKHLLINLGFERRSGMDEYVKIIGVNKAALKVNFDNHKIVYPEAAGLTVNERQTCNFSSPENFVVFECVHRLLAKGYDPKHIELEPRWQLGRGASGGRADILVKDRQDKALLLIECKTWDDEFKKERKRMLAGGGQLFSYLQQERSAKYLCLYASNFDNGEAKHSNAIVRVTGGEPAAKNPYDEAKNARELFLVWKEKFNCYFHYNGIFEEDVNAYEIELKPLKGKDLLPLDEASGVFGVFMEILRHNNISDNANAFNRVLSLFLCKIVDENKGDNEVLDFQVKEGEDNAEKVQDRLQNLYHKGMKRYLGQETIYFKDDDIAAIIKKYPRQTPIEKLEDMFRQIKYYTNNEFAFKEVHNKELFEQNARVLHEVIKMLQNYRFRYNSKQQMLGDFFELLLNHGVKQSEGQFFTPVPLVRFIVRAVALDAVIDEKLRNKNPQFLPRVLDYACGAGHFLTESIDEIQRHIAKLSPQDYKGAKDKEVQRNIKRYRESVEWAQECIYGVEKDYRLARTTQIACFLNGDGDANVIYGDGLEDHAQLHPRNKRAKFDIVIANPPYSVRQFKKYLTLKNSRYKLFDSLSDGAKEIETLFLERAAQALRYGGRAGIIFPSSILSSGGIYEKARELLLEAFELVSIVELEANTFAATGTKPVVLFLRRRNDDFAKDRRYISEDLFNGVVRKRKLDHIDSYALLRKYVAYRNVDFGDYETFRNKDANVAMQKTQMFADYKREFDALTEIKSLRKQLAFAKLPAHERQEELNRRFYQMARKKEQEKFYFFMLSLNNAHNPQQVALVKAGTREAEEAFLGYTFSSRRGSEGIQIRRDDNGRIANKMYDEENHCHPGKAATFIRNAFAGAPSIAVDESIREHVGYARLIDMMDFERKSFDKKINPSRHDVDVNVFGDRWPAVKLAEIVEAQNGLWEGQKGELIKIPVLRNTEFLPNGKLVYGKAAEIEVEKLQLKKRELQDWDILLEKSGGGVEQPVGRVALFRKQSRDFSFGNFIARIRSANKGIKQRYLFLMLAHIYDKGITYSYQSGIRLMNLDEEGYMALKIPMPPIVNQEKIISECAAIDAEAGKAQAAIAAARKSIAQKLGRFVKFPKKELGGIVSSYETGSRPKGGVGGIFSGAFSLGGEHIHPENGRVDLKSPKYVPVDFYEKETAGKLQEGDILLCKDGALTGKVALLRDELAGQNAMVNEHVFLLRCQSPHTQRHLFYFLFSNEGQAEIKKRVTGSAQGGLNTTNLREIPVPVPPEKEQKKFAQEAEKLEAEIAKARALIDSAAERKNAVLEKHLN